MLEVFTVGGGEYLVNTFNAVAAWSGGGGYRSMLQVVMVMGLAYSLLVVAFNLDWRAWLNWFLQATMIYLMLLVPTVTVKVTDRLDPGLAPATVANVPLGLGVMASFTSQVGDWMTRTAETVFVMPNALQLSTNGIVYGARLFEKAQGFELTDAELRANLDEHFKQCVFYDVLLGFNSMNRLQRSTDLWADIGPGSEARAQKWIARVGGASTTNSEVVTCRQAYQALSAQLTPGIEDSAGDLAAQAYPDIARTAGRAVALAKLKADLPVVATQMHGATSADAITYLRQVSMVDAFRRARESFSDTGWDAYAAQRADAQARNTYTSIAQQAMTWVPLLNIVLTVVFYAMFPVIFPLFLFPRTGPTTLKGYATGFFYLAAWGPLYVVLHMFVMSRAASAMSALAPTAPTLLVADGIGSVNNDIATVAGFLMMSVPFIAAGMARGAMAIAGHATSMLAPAQNAAEQAANERTTGNYAYGNVSMANTTANTLQANKWDNIAAYASGFASSRYIGADGGAASSWSDGSMSFDQRQAISSLAFTPSRSEAFGGEMRRALSEGAARVDSIRQSASESWGATATAAIDLMTVASRSRSSATETGSGINNSLSRVNEVSQSLSKDLQSRFGLTKSEADRLSQLSLLSADGTVTGSLSASRDKMVGVFGASVAGSIGGRIAAQRSRDTGRTITVDEALAELESYAARESNSARAQSARDEFLRETSSSSNSEVRSLSEKLGASTTQSRSVSSEASKAEETFARVSRDVSESASRGYSLSTNETQEFVTFVQEELLKPENAVLASSGWSAGVVTPRSEHQRQVRAILLERFVAERVDSVREDLGLTIPDTLDRTLRGPAINDAAGVESWGERNAGSLRSQAPEGSVRTSSRDLDLASQVSDRIGAGAERIDEVGLHLGGSLAGARDRAEGVREDVADRGSRPLVTNAPGVSTVYEGARERVNDAAEWIQEKLGIGGSRVLPLERGERPNLPVAGSVGSGPGPRVNPVTHQSGYHNGIDIAAPAGTPIQAPASGAVVRNGYQEDGAGNYLVVRHGDGSESKYFHMQQRSPHKEGDRVQAGEVLGRVGSTGRSTGPHLHYEIWKDGRVLDPRRHKLKDG